MNDAARLRLADIAIRFDQPGANPITIVESYDLELDAGKIHCLAGRSGSGKTSILRVAAGLVRPSAGTVSWGVEVLDELNDDRVTSLRRRHVGYLDQGGVLMEGLTAIENVLLPALPDGAAHRLTDRAWDLLDQLGVGDRAEQLPRQLSGGERQRVALARALLLEPQVVMADEPTASLDRTTADGVIELLTGLTSTGTAVLVAAHDERLIEAADTTTVLT